MSNIRIFSAPIFVGLLALPTLATIPNLLAPVQDEKTQASKPQEVQERHVQFTARTKPPAECQKSQKLIALLRQQEREKQQREDYQRFEARVLLAKYTAKAEFVNYLTETIQQLPIDSTHEIIVSVPKAVFRDDLNLWRGENGWKYFKNGWSGKIIIRERYQNHSLLPAFKAVAEVLNYAQEQLAPHKITLKITDKKSNEQQGDEKSDEADSYLSVTVPPLDGFEPPKQEDTPLTSAPGNLQSRN